MRTLFVSDEVFRSGDDSNALHALYRLSHGHASQPRVGRETLPVATTGGISSQGARDRRKHDINTLVSKLLTDGLSLAENQVSIPGRSRRLP